MCTLRGIEDSSGGVGDGPERGERKGLGRTQTKGNLTVKLMKLSFQGKCWEFNRVPGGREDRL